MKIGDKVRFRVIAHKARVRISRNILPQEKPDYGTTFPEVNGQTWSMWTRKALSHVQEGVYIGYRTVKDGVVWYVDDEVGNAFSPKRNHRVYLVVVDEHTNPIRVFPEDIEQ